MPNYAFYLSKTARLKSSRVTDADKAAEPVSGSENKCPQSLIVLEFQTQSDCDFFVFYCSGWGAELSHRKPMRQWTMTAVQIVHQFGEKVIFKAM